MIKNAKIAELVKKYMDNRLSHVFLIETNDKSSALNDLLEFIKVINCPHEFLDNCQKCNLCHLISTNNLPSLKIINPDGQAIKEYQMEELKRTFIKIPYLSKYNVYIINDADKFNSFSANTMLKFIEEPTDNLIGFLITNNKENVIDTIKSRCEIIKSYYEEDNIDNHKLLTLASLYLSKIEIEKKQSIVYNKIILDEKLEKEEIVELFKIIYKIYLDILNDINPSIELISLKELSYQEKLKRVYLVNEIIEKLNYNVNSNLILDYFVLSLEE